MKKFINIIIILLIGTASYAQVYQAYLNAADLAYATEDYRSAVSYYGEALELEQEAEPALLIKYADAARKYKAYSTAEAAYNQLLDSDDAEYMTEALFQLSQIKKVKGQYEEAKTMLEKYLQQKDSDKERSTLASKSMKDIIWAMSLESADNVSVERLDDKVNTEFSDMSPVYINDVLYYSSNNYYASSDIVKPYSKIYAYENGKSQLLDSPINEGDQHAGHYTLNQDASQIYFTRCNYELEKVKCKIFVQSTNGDKTLTELPANINSPGAHSSQPNIGLDPKTGEEVLYFTSDRAGGAGGMDIYYAPIKDGVYQGPFALDAINTIGDEVSPFYHVATHKLYFSTDGRSTLGGYDIYSATNGAKWEDVANLGLGINTGYDEAYYFLNEEGTEAYFASNRIGSAFIDEELEACCYDIYIAKQELLIEDVLVKTYDKPSNTLVPGVKLTVRALPALSEEQYYDEVATEYALKIRRDLNFSLEANKPGYEIAKLELEGKALNEEEKIFLTPIKLSIKGFVLNENKEKLGDFTYTITPENETTRTAKKVGSEKAFSDTITKHKDYTILVEKEGYHPETITLKKEDLLKEAILDLDIALRKISAAVMAKLNLDGYLPMPLFFDNDEPGNKTTSETTTQNYHGTFMKYHSRLPQYLNENKAGLNQEAKLDIDANVKAFFQNKVKFGDDALDDFTAHLLNFLQEGSQAEIMLRGYASPRFNSSYNDALTSRRVRSVENHFYQWRSGALIEFINSGQLKLTERLLGESQAPPGVSDELTDKKGSIYSVEASTERRVEILEIKSSNLSPY